MTISDTGSMATGRSFLVCFCKERHKDINVSLSLKSLQNMPSISLQVGLVDFQMGNLLHFGNVAPFSLDTTHTLIAPANKICKYVSMQCSLILDIHMSHAMRKPVL